MSETVVDNRAWADATPRLSVLIPFMRDDPCQLLRALDGPVKGVEVIVLDDGTGDPELTAKVAVTAQEISLPCRFISLARNEGRAKGRNRLTRHARAARFLFLDSDMLPDSTAFLVRWLDLVEEQDPAVAFGGFSVIQAPRRREHALHRMMAMGGDCAPSSDALDLAWVSPQEAVSLEFEAETSGGQGRLIRLALAHCGVLP